MSAAPTSPPAVAVPQWLFVMVTAGMFSGLAAGAVGMAGLRDQVRDLGPRVDLLEQKTRETQGVEGRLIVVETKLDLILKAVLPPPSKGK